MSENVIQDILPLLAERKNLPRDKAQRAFQVIMNGGATPAQMAAFLMGLRIKGETAEEITAGAEVLRAKAARVKAPEGAIDVCGTGGDAKGTLNVSTAVAFVVAGSGVPVVKHGNRAVSSACGSADVLTALGVKIDGDAAMAGRCLREANICFLSAPRYHPAMRHVAPIRQEMKLRTIFNLLGPLANPAAPKQQLLGVYAESWLEPMAEVLRALGAKRAWIVHGSDGMDELTTTGPSQAAELKNGAIRRFEVTPEEAGLKRATLEALRGKDVETNTKALHEVLQGMTSPFRDIVVLNAAAALVVAGQAESIAEGAKLAVHTLDEGKAYKALHLLVEWSHSRG